MRATMLVWVVMGVLLIGASAQGGQGDLESGFWVALASGAAGSSSTSDASEFWFASPHAPALVVTNSSGAGTVAATTGGGVTYFTPLGTPVLLPTTDGYATLSETNALAPTTALPRFAGGAQASGAPTAGNAVPTNADRLSLSILPATSGSMLTITVSSPSGQSLGQTDIAVPTGGWWLIGAGPGASTSNQNGGDPISAPGSGGTGDNGGPVGAPEPACGLLALIGGCFIALGGRLRCKANALSSVRR
jgi:hypothetical protein